MRTTALGSVRNSPCGDRLRKLSSAALTTIIDVLVVRTPSIVGPYASVALVTMLDPGAPGLLSLVLSALGIIMLHCAPGAPTPVLVLVLRRVLYAS
jgi:hypothetical protein